MSEVNVWPQNQSELDDVAEKIARYLKVPFVLLMLNLSDLPSGLNSAAQVNLSSAKRDGLIQFIKKYLDKLHLDYFQIKSTLLNDGETFSQNSQVIKCLSSINLHEFSLENKKDFPVLVIGTAQSLERDDVMNFQFVSQRLCELFRVHQLKLDLKAINQFLSIASHELKTPLTSIYGILQLQERMLRQKKDQPTFPDQDSHHNYLKMVIRQVERLNELIDGLLDMSRIQNGRFMIEPIMSDVATILRECVQSRLTVIAQEAGISLNLESNNHFYAWVDPVRIEEVISNLVMNAIRFSPEGGVVWIRLREEERGFRLVVRDQGASLSTDDRERIFRPFERVPRSSRLGGLGLGLFISRQIAQLHGGNVSLIESLPGKGNSIEAYFPMRNPNAEVA